MTFQMPRQEQLSSLTARLLGFTGEKILQRNNLVWNLRKEKLQKADFQAILAFLKETPQKDEAHLGLHSLKNDLLTFIIEDGRFKDSTATLMLEIINDPDQHPVMREYVLQYIPDYFEKHWLTVKGALREEKKLTGVDLLFQEIFIKSLWDISESTVGNGLAGTALIDLHELSSDFTKINTEKIAQRTESILQDSSMPDSSRMAAFSVASERGFTHLFEKAKNVLFSEQEGLPLRLSALHTASTMAPDQQFTEKLKKEFIENKLAHRFLKRAAGIAIKNNRGTQNEENN
jgi:hypothetical protein